MPQRFYPATLYPADKDGLHGVVVPGVNINASGASQDDALAEAAAMLQEVLDDLGATAPGPVDVADAADDGATVVLIPAMLPGQSQRINITMDEDLIRRIDAVSSNRSSFLASAARAQLASTR